MELRTLIVVVLVAIVGQHLCRRRLRVNLDPEWRDRWRQLPLRDRWRIARAAQRGGDVGPDETALAAGAARFQQRMVPFPIGTWTALLIAIAMTVAVAVAGNFKPAAFGMVLIGLLAWRLVRSHRTRRNLALRAAQAEPAGTAGLNARR